MTQLDVVGLTGAGLESLTTAAQQSLAQAEIIYGSERQLKLVAGFNGNYQQYPSPFSALKTELESKLNASKKVTRIVLLASGDPLFFGIGAWLQRTFESINIRFHPQPSSIQLAFSRIAKPWQNAKTISLHGRPLNSLRATLGKHSLLAILTDANSHPVAIAKELVQMGFAESTIWVAEDLDTDAEKISKFPAKILAAESTVFSPLNVVIIEARGQSELAPAFPGIANSAFSTGSQTGGMISKREVRLAALSRLQPAPGEVGWDIGAGCGGIAIEWARWNPQGTVYAVEMNQLRLQHLSINQERFGTYNLSIIDGQAPDILQSLPSPQAIYLGGSNGQLSDIIDYCWQQLSAGGRLVIPAVTLETRAILTSVLAEKTVDWLEISVATAKQVGSHTFMKPQLPVLLATLIKP